MNAEQIYKALVIASDMGLIDVDHEALAKNILSNNHFLQDYNHRREGLPVFWAVAAKARSDTPAGDSTPPF